MLQVQIEQADRIAATNLLSLLFANDIKMSKSVGNIIDHDDAFDTVGADALRRYFLARLSPDVPKRVSAHMADWPVADPDWQNVALLFDIEVVQKVVGLARLLQ